MLFRSNSLDHAAYAHGAASLEGLIGGYNVTVIGGFGGDSGDLSAGLASYKGLECLVLLEPLSGDSGSASHAVLVLLLSLGLDLSSRIGSDLACFVKCYLRLNLVVAYCCELAIAVNCYCCERSVHCSGAVLAVVRDREYDVTQGTPDSRITYFTANPNGEAEIIKVTLKPNPRVRRIIFEEDFSNINIKGRQAMGNILTKLPVHKIALKQRGGSTLGGRKVWFDRDVLRLNYDGRGEYLGEFQSEDTILVVQNSGEFYATNFDLNNHYDDGIRVLEKYDPNKVWTAVLYDADQQNYPYIKRFCFEATARKQNYLGENKNSSLILLTDECYPRLEVVFGGHDNFREPMVVEADEFIAVKGFKAKGKRLTTYTIETINELEPTRQPEPSQKTEEQETDEEPEILDPDHGKSEGDILDEMTGQMKLF